MCVCVLPEKAVSKMAYTDVGQDVKPYTLTHLPLWQQVR